MKEKTYVEDVDRNMYDFRNDEKDAYRIKNGLTEDIVVDELGVILGTYTGEGGALRLRDPKLFEGVLDLFRNLGPVPFHLCVGTDVGGDVVHV